MERGLPSGPALMMMTPLGVTPVVGWVNESSKMGEDLGKCRVTEGDPITAMRGGRGETRFHQI